MRESADKLSDEVKAKLTFLEMSSIEPFYPQEPIKWTLIGSADLQLLKDNGFLQQAGFPFCNPYPRLVQVLTDDVNANKLLNNFANLLCIVRDLDQAWGCAVKWFKEEQTMQDASHRLLVTTEGGEVVEARRPDRLGEFSRGTELAYFYITDASWRLKALWENACQLLLQDYWLQKAAERFEAALDAIRGHETHCSPRQACFLRLFVPAAEAFASSPVRALRDYFSHFVAPRPVGALESTRSRGLTQWMDDLWRQRNQAREGMIILIGFLLATP